MAFKTLVVAQNNTLNTRILYYRKQVIRNGRQNFSKVKKQPYPN